MPKPTIFIGIDPAFRESGFAICIIDTTDRTARFKMFLGFLEFIAWLLHEAPAKEDCFFCVENSNLQSNVFDMTGKRSVLADRACKVGKNMAVSQLTCDVLKVNKFSLLAVSPKEKGAKWTEIQAQAVLKQERITTEKNGLNQDERDALKVALLGKSRNGWAVTINQNIKTTKK